MFGDIGWAELLLIGIVALIVIGPEDLPQMFRQLGRFTAKMRAMSRDFSRAMDQAAKESGVKDVTDTVKGATSATSVGLNKVKAAADRFEKWDPIKSAAGPSVAKPIEPVVATSAVNSTLAAANSANFAEPTIRAPDTKAPDTKSLLKAQTQKQSAVMKSAQAAVAKQSDTETAPKPRPPAKTVSAEKPAVGPEVAKPRAAKKPKKADAA